jgi:hypothetical protein
MPTGGRESMLSQIPREGFNIRPASCELGSHKPKHSVRDGATISSSPRASGR